MKAVLLNGPPSGGKDTIGRLICTSLRSRGVLAFEEKFAQPIIETMRNLFGVSCADGLPKGVPCGELSGRTRREVAISFSEDWIKPNFGRSWFAEAAVRRMRKMLTEDVWTVASRDGREVVFVFTDSGFLEEARVLVQQLGSENVLQLKLHRPGYGFNGDSRDYWHLPHCTCIEHDNDCSLEELPNVVQHSLLPRIIDKLSIATR